MPIRPENRKLYPPDWAKIPDCRAHDRQPHPVTGSHVVLTIAHLDHNPTNNDPSNLRAWCQKCHNTYDARQRAANNKARKLILPAGSRNLILKRVEEAVSEALAIIGQGRVAHG